MISYFVIYFLIGFVQDLCVVGFLGEIDIDCVLWVVMLMDNLVYQIMFDLIVVLMDVVDLVWLMQVLVWFGFVDLYVIVWGGGIGMNG